MCHAADLMGEELSRVIAKKVFGAGLHEVERNA